MDLAVGVVIGAAFGAVVNGLVESFINPLIAWIAGKPNFDQLTFELPPINPLIENAQPTVFEYGKIITAGVNFFLVALAVYIFIVVPMNKLKDKLKKQEEATPAEPIEPAEEVLLLREIRDSLRKQNQL